MATFLVPKSSEIFFCKICDYSSSRKSQYVRHLATDKHKKRHLATSERSASLSFHCPMCKKVYKHHTSLCKHKKKCSEQKQSVDSNLVIELLKQNQELQRTIIELSKEKTVVNNFNNNNNNNKTFNLHFFLNEQCKDALNIKDFIDSIKIQLSDLEITGKIGYVEGISKVFIKNLKELDTTKRPIHCSDLKREILYVKDENRWLKENDDKDKLQRAIKEVANKNIKQIIEWTKENPGCYDSNSKNNDKYLKIISNSMSGASVEEQQKNINKIISNVAKEVIIEK